MMKASLSEFHTEKELAYQLSLELRMIPFYENEIRRLKEEIAFLNSRQKASSRFPTKVPDNLLNKKGVMPSGGGRRKTQVDLIVEKDRAESELRFAERFVYRLKTVLESLNEHEKDLLISAFIEGESRTSIANNLGISRQSLNRKLNKILLKTVRNRTLYA